MMVAKAEAPRRSSHMLSDRRRWAWSLDPIIDEVRTKISALEKGLGVNLPVLASACHSIILVNRLVR